MDIGSHSCRLKIAQYQANQWITLKENRYITRLMQGVSETGFLAEETMQATFFALQNFKNQIDSLGVAIYRAVATSAMREAQNAFEFQTRIQSELGIKVDVISGEEEAALSYAGMKEYLTDLKAPLMLDVGGGSSEFYCPDVVQISLKMGAVRATEEHLTEKKAQNILEPLIRIKSQLKNCSLVGCGGTITTLAAIFYKMEIYDRDLIQGCKLTKDKIITIYQRLSALSFGELCHVAGLQPQRANVIVQGIFWVLQIMENLEFSTLWVSDADLQEGVLRQLAQKYLSKA